MASIDKLFKALESLKLIQTLPAIHMEQTMTYDSEFG